MTVALPLSLAAQISIVDAWKYSLAEPGEGWTRPSFDDGAWTVGAGGFGTPDTPGARVGTRWETRDIWLRKVFLLDTVPAEPALLIHHDEDAEVYINGRRVASFDGYSTEYTVTPLSATAKAALKSGPNLLAIHCRQTGGGQFIDVHLVDAGDVPELPSARRDPFPFKSDLITPWGASVTPENAWTEYPRPQLERENWRNLNGQWDYAITSAERQTPPVEWSGKILVPYCLESKLGGVQRLLEPFETLWYRREFAATPGVGRRTLLNFEAVDYSCEAFLNGRSVGKHRGGNTPFTFDVTDAVRSGSNELIVRVEDKTEAWQLRGKQVLNPHGIWYTQVSGIWQTVWLEEVGASYIQDLKIQGDPDTGTIRVQTILAGGEATENIQLTVLDGDRAVARLKGGAGDLSIRLRNARNWSPTSPHLYGLEIVLFDDADRMIDRVRSYAGIRKVGKARDEDGHLRFTLNGREVFHWGPLDQGWWPDGLLTPPSDEAMVWEIEFLKSAGFNMIRKHIKVEPRRYYYHCDRLGMMVWQDQVSSGHNPPWTRLQPDPVDADWPDEHHKQFMLEFERMIGALENHPSIVVWVPFNEAWAQHRTLEVGKWTINRDPSRLVNIASGGNFWPVGDIVDHHSYPHPEFPFDNERYRDFIKVIGEFGGHGFPVREHLWDVNRRNWGYGGLPRTRAEFRERYITSLEMLDDLRKQGIAGGVYTQTTDVEGEINGLITYDRKVIKIPAADLATLHRRLFESERRTNRTVPD